MNKLSTKNKLKGFILEILPNELVIYLKKMHYFNSLKQFDGGSENDLSVIKYIVNRGDTVIDIGANVGWYTKILSDLVSDSGRVLSIEPIPETFMILSWCVKRLALSNVDLLKCAVSEIEGIARMEVPKYDFGGNNFYRSRIVNSDKQKNGLKYFTVKLKSLGSLMSYFKDGLSFIKCDVEGNELLVIKGAYRIISKFKPAWLIEISSDPDESDSSASELFYIMHRNGYDVYWYDGKSLNKRQNGDKSTNYFFFTPNQLENMTEIKIRS